MTQENDSAPKSGTTPDAAAAPAKKASAAKKTPAKKPAAPKAATEKTAAPAAEKAKAPAKKPRTAEKPVAKEAAPETKPAKPAARATAKSAKKTASTTVKTDSPAAAAPAKPRRTAKPKTAGQATDAAPVAPIAKTPAKPVAKTAAKGKPSAKPAAAEASSAEPATARQQPDNAKAADKDPKAAAPKAKASRAGAAKAKVAPPASKTGTDAAVTAAASAATPTAAANAPAEEKKTQKQRPPRAKNAAKQSSNPAESVIKEPARDKQAETDAARAPKPQERRSGRQSTPAAAHGAPRGIASDASAPVPAATSPAVSDAAPAAAASATASPTTAMDAPAGDAQNGENAQPPAKARRSRRGGRRRNKSRNAAAAAAENAALPGAEPSEDSPAEGAPAVTPVDEPAPAETGEPQEAAPQESAKREPAQQQAAKQASSRGKQKPAARKNDSKKSGTGPKDAEDAEDAEEAATVKTSNSKRKMFISVLSGELVEVVLAEEGQVVEYYVEMQHQAKVKGNIYKGVVSNIDANLQAAFISYAGGVKNGFLQIDEVHPEYYLGHYDPAKGRKYPPIQKVLKPGQEILVQVVKEPAGTKGAFLTSYLSLPGRFLVLTPGREQIGVSRKVDNDEERSRLRAMLEGLNPGKGLGVIVRTVSTGASKTSLQRDLQFLKRLWKDVRTKGQISPAPSLIYEELDLSTRAVRDYLTDDVQEVWVDDASTAAQVTELATLLFPKKNDLVQVHQESGQSLFERFSLQKQLDQIHSREVSLPSGGSLVIDKTEALTAIDINSGRSGGKTNFEDMAYRTNLEAAKAIPLQLRLRDIGGQIVADFIEMRDRDHWREVEKAVRTGMKGDRARYDVGKIGPFGMLEIVRQRLGSSAISISTEPCPCCKGTGIRRNMEWQAMQCLREIGRKLRQAAANNQPSMTYQVEPELAFYLLNTKRATLRELEIEAGTTLIIGPKTE